MKRLTVAFCLYKHLGSTSAPINNPLQISRLDRRELQEVCVSMCVLQSYHTCVFCVFCLLTLNTML